MKNLLIAISALLTVSSCTGVAGWFGKDTDSLSLNDSDDQQAMYRDESITPANSYSDLFLDSSTIEKFVQTGSLDTKGAQIFRNFYLMRNHQFAWFTSQGLTEEGRNMWSLYSNSDSVSKKANNALKQRMDSLLQGDSISISRADSAYVQAELALTQAFVHLASDGEGLINTQNLYYVVPAKKTDPLQLADSILNKQTDSSMFSNNTAYRAMKQHLNTYYTIVKNGGWQPIQSGSIKKGSKGAAVVALKKRLQLTNDFPAGDTTAVYTDSLGTAIKDVQLRYGLQPTGNVNDSLITVLNVPAEERLQQILLNMNRLVWMEPSSDTSRIEVNVPTQTLYVFEGNNKVMEMPVIVGKEGTNTMAFSGKINQVVFSPAWNLPRSIVQNEILPAMKKDKNYLKKKNMEIVGENNSIPTIKQLPGKDNALGKVKFLFPNSYDIYLHDTPDKSLFKKKDRALSHGCIRVADPEKLAQYVLRNQKEWTPEKIRAAMNAGKEHVVSVNSATPVNITYLTTWADQAGKLHFRSDVYSHDKKSMARMFTTTDNNLNVAGRSDSTNVNADTVRSRTAKP